MTLAVVLLNWNAAERTLAVVRSLQDWTRIKPTIYVVDNASTDEDKATLSRGITSVHLLVNETNRGFAGGNNVALRAILSRHHDAVLLLNNDAELKERDAVVLLDHLAQNPAVAAVGPLLLDHAEARSCTAGGRNIAWHAHTHCRRSLISPRLQQAPAARLPVDYIPGTAILIRTSLFRELGLLDENYFFSGEVADFCLRAQRAGYRCCVAANAQAIHGPDHDTPLRRTLYLYYSLRNRFLLIRKFYPNTQRGLFAWWTMIGHLMAVRARWRGDKNRVRAIMLALRDGHAGVFGNHNEYFT